MDQALADEEEGTAATPLHLLGRAGTAEALAAIGPEAQAFAAAQRFEGKAGQALATPLGEGRMAAFGLGDLSGPAAAMALRGAAGSLPAGRYRIACAPDGFDRELAALGFALGARRFTRYKSLPAEPGAVLEVAGEATRARLLAIADACALACDMVDTPASDMGPAEIEALAREAAQAHGAAIEVVAGEALARGYPAIHAVGRAAAADRAPRLVELSWGEPDAPRLALVGKGVTFDTGGLDIKPSSGMRNMKKDMGGAAHALALARMVMAARLPVRLCLLLPLAENAIGPDAMRPGDVLSTRAGLSVEVGNTDAEGRLILADALARAGELEPELTVDLATLTGAARAALGPELPPFYTADDGLAAALEASARAVADPLWRMPLWAPYDAALDSDVADLKNDGDAWAQAGSITAALFLQRFAPASGGWLHLDIFAWNPRKRPGWPVGGEAQAIRALFHLLQRRYGAAR